jgi:uncharacterized protein (UPF0332 family)
MNRPYTLRKLVDYEGFISVEEKERVEPLISFAKELIKTMENLIKEEL